MAALGIIISIFAYYAVLFDFGCYWSGPDGPPCTDGELQEQHIKDFLQAAVSPLFYTGLASAIIAFIAWANVRRW